MDDRGLGHVAAVHRAGRLPSRVRPLAGGAPLVRPRQPRQRPRSNDSGLHAPDDGPPGQEGRRTPCGPTASRSGLHGQVVDDDQHAHVDDALDDRLDDALGDGQQRAKGPRGPPPGRKTFQPLPVARPMPGTSTRLPQISCFSVLR